MQQGLDQPKGTQPGADEPANQRPNKDQKPGHVESKFEISAADDRLEGTEGAGTHRAGTGIAIHPRYAQVFQPAPVNLSLYETGQIAVGQRCQSACTPCRGHSLVFSLANPDTLPCPHSRIDGQKKQS